MDDWTIAILALVGIGAAAMFVQGNGVGKTSARKQIDRNLYGILVKEGVDPDTARDVILSVPATTDFKKKFFGEILKDAADYFLHVNKHDYVDYDNWQRSRVENLAGTMETNFQPPLLELQEMLDNGPFGDQGTKVMPLPNTEAVVFFSESHTLHVDKKGTGTFVTKQSLILFIQTIDVVLTNNAIAIHKPNDMIQGLLEFIKAFFSNSISLEYEEALGIVMDESADKTSVDPQDWAIAAGHRTAYTPSFMEMVSAARAKYFKQAALTTDEIDRTIDVYQDLVAAAAGNISVPDAHAFLDDNMRANARYFMYSAGAQEEDGNILSGQVPLPRDIEELQASLITEGFTFDEIEQLNEVLESYTSKEEAIAALNDPDVISTLGPAHQRILELIQRSTKLEPPQPAPQPSPIQPDDDDDD